ncbi:O-antigen polymerase [Novosphingobium sp.]|uniref:O-antigen polymerase n=1 Tax=Novosphingobium sp. TaxID=1874826 RepID=UPI00286BD719|nr:O-antigen polymerase [Novosphingobium sp.]
MFEVAVALSLLAYVAVSVTYLRSRYFSVFHPFTLYCLFHGLVFVLRPVLSIWLEYDYVYRAHHFMPTTGDRTVALLAANLGFLAFAFFSFRPGSGAVEMRFVADPLLQDERYRLSRYFIWAMAICAPVAVWSLWGQFGAALNNEAYADMVLDRTTGVAYNTTGTGYFYEAQLMLVPLTTIIAWVFRFRLLALLPAAVFVLVRAGTGGRGPFIAALFALGLFYLYHIRRKYPPLRAAMGLLAIGALFVAIGQDRGYGLRTALGGEVDSRINFESSEPFLGGMDWSNMEYLEYVVYVVPQRSQSYTYFTELLQIFTEPIPRVLWPGKPIGPPIKFFSMFDYGYPIGATYSLPGVGWMGLGWLGVIMLCGAWGYVLGLIYRRFVESDQSTFKVAAYMCFLPIFVVAFRDGLVLTVLRQLVFYMFPIVVWVAIARLFNVPLASDLRAAAARLRRREAMHAPAPSETDQLESQPAPIAALYDGLPPAVRRRRLALSHGQRPD